MSIGLGSLRGTNRTAFIRQEEATEVRWLIERIAGGLARPGRFGESLVRLLVGLLALGWLVGLSAVGHSTRQWNPVSAGLILVPFGLAIGLSIWQLSLVGAPDVRLAPRRFGVPSRSSPPQPNIARRSEPDGRLVFETYRRLPIMGILFWSLTAAVAWWLLLTTDWGSGAALVKAAAAVVAPGSSVLAARSALILRYSSKAIELDRSEIRLSPAVGFIPQLAIPREDVLLLALNRGGASRYLSVHVASGRTYYVPIHNVVGTEHVYDLFLDAWPEHDRVAWDH